MRFSNRKQAFSDEKYIHIHIKLMLFFAFINFFQKNKITGRTVHVMTYEVGAVLEDAAWQAPVYCFQKNDTTTEKQLENPEMFLFDDAPSINHNLIRQKTTLRSSSGS